MQLIGGGIVEKVEALQSGDKVIVTIEHKRSDMKIGGLSSSLLRRKPVQISSFMQPKNASCQAKIM